jgi:hypothetical protein
MMKSLVAARLNPRHLSAILGVNRVTASRWLHGKAMPHHLWSDRVAAFIAAVDRALEAGKLPLPPDMERQAELDYLRGLIREFTSEV